MKRVFLAALIVLSLFISSCAALAAEETTTALENGHIRLPFANGYHGFCIAYDMPSAAQGDTYTIHDTSAAKNRIHGTSIGNYLKIFATQHTDLFFDDTADIVVQHHFWHFSDNFNGWRIDYDLIEEIKTAALHTEIPDHGYQQITESGQIATWDFAVLDEADGGALFFAYKRTLSEPPVNPDPPVDPDLPIDSDPSVNSDPQPDIPETGDTSSLALWGTLLMLAAGAMAVLRFRRA